MNADQQKTQLIPFVTEILKDIRNGNLLTPDGDKYSKKSTAHYTSLIRWLKNYEVDEGITYAEDIDEEWVEEWLLFLIDTHLAKNTIASTMIALKACLNRLYKKKIISFNPNVIDIVKEITTAVYTTVEEIDLFIDLNLEDNPDLKLARDAYVIQSYTGLRFCDLKNLMEDINKYLRTDEAYRYFEIKTKKTGAEVSIPIADRVNDILCANNYAFKSLDYNSYNKNIKIVAEKAGLNNLVVISRTYRGVVTEITKPKWACIFSHTARRSFATNAFLEGMKDTFIMQITGHTTYESFHRYIRCSPFEAALRISDHPFFSIQLEEPGTIINTPTFLLFQNQASGLQHERIYVSKPSQANKRLLPPSKSIYVSLPKPIKSNRVSIILPT